MTDSTTLAPTDAEILDAAEDFRSQYTHGGTTFDEFDEIGFARAVLAKWGAPAPASSEPVAVPAGVEPVVLLKFAVWDDGELRLLSGRKGPAFDCELYAMPDGKRAPDLFTAAQVQTMLAAGLAPGWQAVPVEPTSEMVIEAYKAQGEATSSACEEIYRAMLAAAPSGPAREPMTDEMVLAAARVMSPQLFKHGLEPLPGDGPVTSKRMESEAEQVRKMLVAAYGITAAPKGGQHADR